MFEVNRPNPTPTAATVIRAATTAELSSYKKRKRAATKEQRSNSQAMAVDKLG